MSQQTFTEAEFRELVTRYERYGPQIYRDGDMWQELDAALTYAATLVRRLEAIRQWAETPIGTEADMCVALRLIGLDEHDASIAATASVKAINDCLNEVRALLTPPEAP